MPFLNKALSATGVLCIGYSTYHFINNQREELNLRLKKIDEQISEAELKERIQKIAEKLDFQDPISDTPVFDYNGDRYRELGDLTQLTPEARRAILAGNFTTCKYSANRTIHLNSGSYKQVAAVVVGTHNDVCARLHDLLVQALIKDYIPPLN